MRETRHHFIPH